MESNVTKIYMLTVYVDEGGDTLYASSTFDGFKRKIAESIASGDIVYRPFCDKDSKTQMKKFLHDFDIYNWCSFESKLSFRNYEDVFEVEFHSMEDSGNAVRNVRPNQVLKVLYFTTKEFNELLKTVFGGGVRVSYSTYGMNIEDNADELTTLEVYHDLAKYLHVNEITSIHNDHCKDRGIWVAYK